MDPIQQPIPPATEFPPAPASPAGVPGITSDQPVGGEMSQEEMRANLEEMMAKLKSKYQEFDDQKFAMENKDAVQKSDALSELFALLESKGIDPNNPEELKAYLDKIKERNPELYQQIETAINALIGGEQTMGATDVGVSDVSPETPSASGETPTTGGGGGGGAPSGQPQNMNINQNETLPQNI